MTLWERLNARFGGGAAAAPAGAPPPPPPTPPSLGPPSPEEREPDLHQLAEDLEHGAPCSAVLLEGLAEMVRGRRARTAVLDGPDSPRLTDLRVIRAGLPPWWAEGGSLLLAADGTQPPDLRFNPFIGPPRRAVLVIGKASRFDHVNLSAEGPLVVIGDGVIAMAGALNCYGASSVLIGEHTTCTNWAMIDCRNGGIIVTGADGMWAHGVSLMTDDTHAIRDAVTGQRLNAFGGRIVIDQHVWLCEQVRVMGGARLGTGSIIGASALVKSRTVPANTVAVGVPARAVRSGVSWSREDVP